MVHVFFSYIFILTLSYINNQIKNFNIVTDYYSFNIFLSLLLYLQQTTEKTNAFFKIYDILGFLKLIYLPQIIQ